MTTRFLIGVIPFVLVCTGREVIDQPTKVYTPIESKRGRGKSVAERK